MIISERLDADIKVVMRPQRVCTSLRPICAQEANLDVEECSDLGRVGGNRELEFRSGRLRAREALNLLKQPTVPINIGVSGAPLWPSGVVGSITHGGGFAGAAAASATQYRSLGIDVEGRSSLAWNIQAVLFSERERERLCSEDAATAMFSAKESVFKAIHPITRALTWLRDIEIDLADQRFTVAAPKTQERDLLRACRGQGYVWLADAVIFTAYLLPQSDQAGTGR